MTTGDFHISCKSFIVIPLIKKQSLDREMLKNYRPVTNLSFWSKIIDKVIYIRILGHIIGGSALRLILSYFYDRTQRVQIDGILSDFASLLCGVSRGSVLGQWIFFNICFHLVWYTIILAITSARMRPSSTFHLKTLCEVKILQVIFIFI